MMGERLRLTRLALGFENQAEFARRIGVQPNVVNNAETGDNRLSVPVIAAIRQAFGLTSDWLLFADQRGLPNEFLEKYSRLNAPQRRSKGA